MSYFGIPIRNGLPIGLGSVAPLASGGGSPFSPLSLFTGGAPGVWYDPSNFATLFQDSAGTTPVTAVEQPVGLQLDLSKGLVLGPELVPSTIPSISGAGWTTNGTSITATSSTASGTIALTASTPSTNFYQVTFTASGLSGATSYMVFSSGVPALTKRINTAKTYSFIVPGQGTAAFEIAPYEGTAFSVTISNITVKELPGNHAFQSTSASRPVLSARYNLLTKTEDFTNAAWSKSGVTLGSLVTAPDGTTTAQSITYTSGGGISNFQYFNAAPIGVTPFGSIWIRASTPITMTLGFFDGSGFDAPVSVTSTWTLFTYAKATPFSSGDRRFWLYPTNAGSNITVEIWHPQVVPTNQFSIPYQRVNTATDYDTTGFLPYLKFDGVDDSLSTNSISFTSTDKMSVFAGVRKLSDAALGMLLETSAISDSNNGTIFVLAPGTVGTHSYAFRSKGTVSQNAQSGLIATAPITNTLTGLGNISGDLATLRLNGAQVAQNTGDQGTGNYGNYPLYIGRRNNASLPFNGQLYSMVIVGKAVTAGELTSTETYVNQKTGAY